MLIEEIYTLIGQIMVDTIDTNWSKAVLKIEFTGNSLGFNFNFWDENKMKKSLPLRNSHDLYEPIEELHKLTTEEGIYTKWNKIDFKLTSDGQMELEYIWDQELYDEIESLSK